MSDNLNCSFCGKPSAEVDKLVAGPAVYICDQCIGLCVEVIAGAGPGPKSSASPDATLEMLPALNRAVVGITADLNGRVQGLRAAGVEWSRIADVLGATDDDVRRRFSAS